MKVRTFTILLITIIWRNLSFGQASDRSEFSFTIEFEKTIPIKKIEVFYFERTYNYFEKVNYKIDKSKNQNFRIDELT
jgi:hypothetical protein